MIIIIFFLIIIVLICTNKIVIENKRFRIVNKNIILLNKNTIDLKNKSYHLPKDLISNYDDAILGDITKESVTIDNYKKLKIVYNELIEFKIVVNSIDALVDSISKTRNDIEKYLIDNYPYCEEYLKHELSKFMNIIKIDNIKYDNNTLLRLTGTKKIINKKLNLFLNKTVKINKIVLEYNNIDNKIEELRKNNIKNINLENYIFNLKSNITMSVDFLKKDDYDNALLYYGKFISIKLKKL